MSKKKQYRNRLNNLFADMGEETAEPSTNGGLGSSGWNWECDSNGQYHACSSEVEAILGVKASDFLGQPLKTFQLTAESSRQLNDTLEKDGELPIEITLHFQSKSGALIPVRTHIFRHQENSWRGFSQVLEDPGSVISKPDSFEEHTKTTLPPAPLATPPPTPSASFSSFGLAIDDDHPISVSTPYSGAGKQSLKQRETISNPAAPGIEAALAVPITMSDQSLGLLEIIDTKPDRDWNEDELRLVEEVADQLALALENAQLFQETQSSLARTDALYRVGQAAIAFEDITELLQSVANTISEVLPANRTLIAVLDRQTENVTHFIESFQKPIQISSDTYQELMDGLTGWAIREQKPALSNIGTEDHRESAATRAMRKQTDAGSVLVVPMMYRDEVFGTVTAINSFSRRGFSQNDIDLLLAMANQVATALANGQLFQQVTSRSQSLQTAAEVSRAASSILDPNPLITQTVSLIRDRFDLYYVGLFLVDERGLWTYEPGKWAVLRAGTGEAGRIQVERGHKLEVGGVSMIGQCISTSQPQISLQVQAEEQRFANPLLPETRSEMALPLISRGQVIGAMSIQSTRPTAFSEDDIAILQTMADQVANALQNAYLFDQTQARAEELAVLNEMSRQLTATVDIDSINRNIYLYSSRLIDTSTFFIALFDGQTGMINFPLVTENNQEISLPARRMGKGMTEYVLTSRKPLLLHEDVEGWLRNQDVDLIPIGSESENEIAQSWLGVPMLAGGNSIGVIGVQHNDPHHYSEQDHDLLVAIASQAAIAIQNTNLFKETRQRTEDLAVLNELSRVLATLLDINMVASTVNEYTTKLMDTNNFFIALYDPDLQEISMPLVVVNSKKIEIPKRQLANGLTDYIIRNRRPLLLNGDISEQQAQLGIETLALGDETPPKSWLGVPMLIGDRVIGAISVQSVITPYLYQDRERDLLSSIASQVAITIQNTRLFDQTQQQLADLMTIQQTTAELSAAISIDDITSTLLENLVVSVQCDTVSLFILRENNLIRTGEFPQPKDQNLIGQTISLDDHPLTKQVIDTHRSIALAADDSRLQENEREAFKADGIIANMTVPLVGPEGALGTLSLNRKHPAQLFSQQEVNLLETLASQAAISMQNARLFEQIQQRSEELQLINRVVSQVAASLNINESLKIIADEIGLATKADSVSVTLLNDSRTSLTVVAEYLSRKEIKGILGSEIPLEGNPATQQVIKTKKRLALTDPQNNPLTESSHELLIRQGVKTLMILPLMVSGEVIGTVGVDILEKERVFSESQIDLIETIILQAATAIENTRLFEQTRRQLRDLSTISDASQTLSSAPLDTRGVAEIIARIFIDVLGGHSTATISLRESDFSDQMITITSLRKSNDEIFFEDNIEQWNFNLSDFPATRKVMDTLKPLVVNKNDLNADPAETSFMELENVQQLIIIPLAIKGQSIGIIELEYFEETRQPTTEDLNLVLTLANQAAVTLENARLYEEQRETAEQLREIDTLKSQFLANMSHELRTPLNSIIGFSRVIMKGIDGPVTDLQQQDLSAIYNAGQHLLNMINDILDISKIEAGKMELAFDDVDIANIIESVLSTARGLIKDKPVKLITAVEENIPIISADPTRIRQVLLNLISNASKFTDEGSITVTARQQISKEGKKEIYIAVTDTGPGIAEEDQNKLFVPFSQVDGSPTRKVGGTGLGLSITRLLVELHGGQIDVVSAEGQGSTFWFTLAMSEDSSDPERQDRYTILAIDDDVQVIKLYERYLADVGYQVIALTNPHEALKEAQRLKPSAITLDIMMPDFDGWELLEKLKSDPEIGQTPVVICSILDEQEKAAQLGASGYLTKPILENDLIEALQKLKMNKNESA